MAELNGKIKKLRRGELCGTASAVFCGAVLIYFAVLFPLGGALRLTALISAPVMLTAGIALSAMFSPKTPKRYTPKKNRSHSA